MSTGPVYQLPRYSLLWVLASLSLVTLPHVLRLPLWVTFLILACIIWRLLIYAGKASYPGKLIRISLVIGAIAAVSFEFRGRVGALDPIVTLLLLGFVFKYFSYGNFSS